MLSVEEGLECEVYVDGMRLDHVSEIKYFGCVLDSSGTDEADCRRMAASGRSVAGAIRSPFNAKGLQFECVKVLHESLVEPGLMYGSGTVIWKEKERSRIRAV